MKRSTIRIVVIVVIIILLLSVLAPIFSVGVQ